MIIDGIKLSHYLKALLPYKVYFSHNMLIPATLAPSLQVLFLHCSSPAVILHIDVLVQIDKLRNEAPWHFLNFRVFPSALPNPFYT